MTLETLLDSNKLYLRYKSKIFKLYFDWDNASISKDNINVDIINDKDKYQANIKNRTMTISDCYNKEVVKCSIDNLFEPELLQGII